MDTLWTASARRDRIAIFNHIANHNPQAAIRLDEVFRDSIASLKYFPKQGKVSQVPGTRELIAHKNYRIVYEIDCNTVWILALVHTAKLWPPLNCDTNS